MKKTTICFGEPFKLNGEKILKTIKYNEEKIYFLLKNGDFLLYEKELSNQYQFKKVLRPMGKNLIKGLCFEQSK